ncbi:MAG: CHASE3 domain-containing protein, partial [Chthoniobacterales bacterium]
TLAQAESAQRSYIITGLDAYLETYREMIIAAQQNLEQLKDLTTDNPEQLRRVALMQPEMMDRLASLEEGIATRDREGLEGARTYVLTGRGKRQMDRIRELEAAMEKSELALLQQRKKESRASYVTTLVTLGLATALGLGLVATGYTLAWREVVTRRRSAAALVRANDLLEQRVLERTDDLALANQSLRHSNQELEQFASIASHDMQEPLRKIQAFGDRLQTHCGGELGEQGRDYLARMLASAGRMRALIDALLTFSRVTTKAQPFVEVDLAAVTADVLADLDSLIHRNGGTVEVGPLVCLEADALQMRQLFQNLIGNGLKFFRPGVPPLVRVTSRLLPADDGSQSPQVEISVADNGIGFEEVYLDRIFELFQRLHGRNEYEGTGMGLAICRKIVLRHGGNLTARSAPDAGATFLITLPLRQPEKGTSG